MLRQSPSFYQCVNNANSIKTKRVTSQSSEAITYISVTENIEEMFSLIIYKSAPEFFFLLKNIFTGIYSKMAAARYSTKVLQMFYGPIAELENAHLPQPLKPRYVVLYVTSHGKTYTNAYPLNG